MSKRFMDRVCRKLNVWEEEFFEASFDINETMVAEEISMDRKYVATLLLAAHNKDTFNRIEKFLEMQMPESRDWAFELCFMGGDCGHARVWVEDISEFDFADAWLVEQYPMVSVKHHEWQTWTADRVENMMKAVRQDFKGDGYKATVDLIEGEAGQPADENITLKIEVADWTLGVFRQMAAMKNFIDLL